MKTKILTGVVLVTLATAGTLTYAASSSTGSTNMLKNVFRGMHQTGSGSSMGGRGGMMKGFDNDEIGGGFMGRGPMTKLTDAEKTKLATMTDAEKKAFFEAKMAEVKALRDSREAVMDKLINGETLSDTEKATLATIKTERTAKKAERVEREAQMAEIKPIMDKVHAGTVLTADEQAKLDAFKATMKQDGKHLKGKKGGMMRGMMR